MAQMQASMFTSCFSWTYFTALAARQPAAQRISMFSSAFRPAPLPQQKVCSRMVLAGISIEVVGHVLDHVARLVQHAHAPGRVAGVVEGDDLVVVAALVQLQLAVLDQVGGELGDVDHLGGRWRSRSGARDGVDRVTSRKSAGPFMVSMYWCITRHMWPHSPPRIHLTPRRLASAYILEVEPLHGVVGGEKAEVAALGGVGAPGVSRPYFSFR
jgi:hypothetical protein